MNAPEFSRIIKLKAIPAGELELTATAEECRALAERFGIERVDSLKAEVKFEGSAKRLHGSGTLRADIVQACAISGEDFAHVISEKLDLVFVPSGESNVGDTIPSSAEIEIELDTEELDEIEYDGDSFDLGEAVSQSLGLAIDPYAEGPNAESVREAAGIIGDDEPSGPLAEALRGLTKKS